MTDVVGTFLTDFIHPGSKEKFNELFALALDGGSKGAINLCVNDKIIPVYISLTSLHRNWATVGVIVTDLLRKEKERRNYFKYQTDLELKKP
jgi:hypothetical protein